MKKLSIYKKENS